MSTPQMLTLIGFIIAYRYTPHSNTKVFDLMLAGALWGIALAWWAVR